VPRVIKNGAEATKIQEGRRGYGFQAASSKGRKKEHETRSFSDIPSHFDVPALLPDAP
jgi:hypothetical protein